jgi:hypothetical protein
LEIIQIKNLEEDLIITFLECRKNLEFDESIIAVLKYEDVRYNKNVKKAWKADIDSLRLIEISTDGIDCLNSGHGV